MSAQPLVVITTRLPPALCGIGTYSWLLRQRWPDEQRRVEFLVVDSQPPDGRSSLGDPVAQFGENAQTLARELERIGAADVLLHYAGRAYHRLGFPFWLPRVLAAWKQKFPGARLLLFVHELPGTFPKTSRHYWLGRLSGKVARRLVAEANVLLTNTEDHARRLRKFGGPAEVNLIPISSNIEPVAPLCDRNRADFLVFGLSFGRLQTLRLFEPFLQRWHRGGLLRRLHLIGPGGDDFAAEADQLLERLLPAGVVVAHGSLPSEKISELLRRAGFTLTNANMATWSKSSAFMAAAAHGCPVLIAGNEPEGIPLDYTVRAAQVGIIADDVIAKRTGALAVWYRENAAWEVTARKIAAL